MSNQARRVIKIEHSDVDSFTSRDDALYDRLNLYDSLTSEGTGLVTVYLHHLEEVIAEAEAGELELSPETIKALKADIEIAKSEGNLWLDYYII
jgi:hypothetical protein